MTITEAKKKYNQLLKRFNKAETYFDREDITYAEKEKFLEDFEKILLGLSYYLTKIEVYTKQQVFTGF